jgi:hypothetical protein
MDFIIDPQSFVGRSAESATQNGDIFRFQNLANRLNDDRFSRTADSYASDRDDF